MYPITHLPNLETGNDIETKATSYAIARFVSSYLSFALLNYCSIKTKAAAASPCVRKVIENLSKNLHVAEILLGIKAGTSPIVAIKKILELIGVKLTRQGREAKGQRLWLYKVEKNPLFETIMERWKQEERVSSKNGIYNIDNTFGTEREIVKTDPPNNGVVITGESSQQHLENRERTEESKIRDQDSEKLGN